MSIHENSDKRVPINKDSFSIERDEQKCILCGACKSVCKFKQGIYGKYNLEDTGDRAICIDCGQCTQVCPVGAITVKNDYTTIKEEINNGKVVIIQTSPSVRVSIGEEFGLEPGINLEKKIVTALKKLGFTYVFDTTFGADLTIMEEATELVNRINNNEKLPLFTSCCPAWVKYVEMFFPEYIDNLSTVKSPILMEGAIIKTYVASKLNIDPSDIVNVALTPCTAKKAEIKRPEMNSTGKYYNNDIKDMDYIITVKEFANWLKKENIDFNSLESSEYDSLLPSGTGAGYIFGNTGGVMEAALRTAYYMLTGNNPEPTLLDFTPVRGLNGVKEAEITINNRNLKIAVITGTNQANKFLSKIKEEKIYYDFIEVMACTGGCIAGGGQPKVDQMEANEINEKRISGLYDIDYNHNERNSYENLQVKTLYDEFLGNPCSELAHKLLHTTYSDKSNLLNVKEKIVN